MNFSTFLFKNPAHDRSNYPLDLNAALRYTRPKTGIDIFPIQDNATVWEKLGLLNGGEGVSGFMPQQDILVWGQAYGKQPSGPIVSGLPTLLANNPFATSAQVLWQTMVPGLTKQDSL